MTKKILILFVSIVWAATPVIASLSDKSEDRNRPKAQRQKMEFIELNDSDVEYHTGSNLQYYKEYHPKQIDKNLLSFPLKACDPLPIYSCGSLRFFFTSAIAGNFPCSGEPILLPDPSMEVRAVRAKSNGNGHWVQVYFGYDLNQYNETGNKKIYQAQLLVLKTKDTRHVENLHGQYFSGAKYLSNQSIALEVRNYLEGPKEWNWRSPIFQGILQQLLPQGEGIVWNEQAQCLIFNLVYWTKDENKLKQITYRH